MRNSRTPRTTVEQHLVMYVMGNHVKTIFGNSRTALTLVELYLGSKKVMIELHSGKKQVVVELHLGSKKYFNKIIMHLKGLDLFYLVTFNLIK
jgi:hypothetical protein